MKGRHKKMVAWGISLSLLCFAGFQMPAPAAWQKPFQPSLAGGSLVCLASHPLDRNKFLVASGREVFEAGKENGWQSLWSQPDAGSPIVKLFSFASLPDTVFAATNKNVFAGNLETRSWREVYKDPEKSPLAFAVHPNAPHHWFLGTRKGLWETDDSGATWSRSCVYSGSVPVPLVLFSGKNLFFAAGNVLFLAPDASAAQPVFSVPGTENANEEAPDNVPAESIPYLLKVHDLIVSQHAPQTLFLATAKGVFVSRDNGRRWEPLPQSGLQSADVLQLALSERTGLLYAATGRGVYVYDPRPQKWSCLFEGLARASAKSIAVLNEESLLAVTGEGFVRYPLGPFTPEAGPALTIYQPSEGTLALFRELLAREPSAREVQTRVIRYANVANGKIKRWHAESRFAGFLPTFSFGKNLDRGTSISTYSGKYITGPEDVSKGWDADVSWDLGNMIYSSDQTSIDSREKLMVELRNDLLSEATRIYYERRRLQIALIYTPPVSEQEHLENLLRMDELTALLDGMTDGFFLKQLERLYREKPALNGLWKFKRTDSAGDSSLGTWNSK